MSGLFALILLVGCTKPSFIQQKCDALNEAAQLNLRELRDHPGTSANGSIYYEDTVSYSIQDDACYESRIREVKPVKWFEVSKVVFATGEYNGIKGTQQVLFSGYCLTNANILAYDLPPDALEEAKKADLCTHVETEILAQYHDKIQELLGK